MKKADLITSVFFVTFFLTFDVHAYFDPGTGSFIVQSILAFLATIAASLTFTYVNFKNFLKKIFKKKKKNIKYRNK
jgi:hypothetical protein